MKHSGHEQLLTDKNVLFTLSKNNSNSDCEVRYTTGVGRTVEEWRFEFLVQFDVMKSIWSSTLNHNPKTFNIIMTIRKPMMKRMMKMIMMMMVRGTSVHQQVS